MSKDEKTVSVISPEVKQISEEFKLPITDADIIVGSFKEVVDRMTDAESQLKAFGDPKEITGEVCAEAKRLRLVFQKIRTTGDDIHKKIKADVLLRSKAIDSARNIFKLKITEREDHLIEFEKHFEKIEEEKRLKVKEEREKKLLDLGIEEVEHLHLADMIPEVWESFYQTKKSERDAVIAAEKKAEEDKKENERIMNLYNERKDSLIEKDLFRFIPNGESYEFGAFGKMKQSEFDEIVSAAKEAKKKHEAEQARIKKENEDLKKEQEKKAKEAAAAKVKADKAAAATKKKHDEEMKAAADKAAKAEKELADKKAADEKVEADQRAKDAVEKARIEKEKLEADRATKNKKYTDFLIENGVTKEGLENGEFEVKNFGGKFKLYKMIAEVTIS